MVAIRVEYLLLSFSLLLVLLGVVGAEGVQNAQDINTSTTNATITSTCFKTVYFTYKGNRTDKLYVGGEIHFPKTLADLIKVKTGGAITKEDDCGWIIEVTKSVVNVEYVKLGEKDFSYQTRTYKAYEFPSEIYNQLKPEEINLRLLSIDKSLNNLTKEIIGMKGKVSELTSRPTLSEQLQGFFMYNPIIYPVYFIFGFLGLLYILGRRW